MKKYLGQDGLKNVLQRLKGKLDLKADKAELAIQSNPNLLDNWYFVGGGSQQGGGQFPINQRGQTEYTAAGYTIDRWRTIASSADAGTTTIGDDGVTLTCGLGSTYLNFQQTIENSEPLYGIPLTFSALVSGSGRVVLVYLDSLEGVHNETVMFDRDTPDLITKTVMGSVYKNLRFIFQNSNAAKPMKILATKLELGDHQTLAHKESGKWVLNDPPPDYRMELLKCKRYYNSFNNSQSEAAGYTWDETGFFCTIPLNTQMRILPTCVVSGMGYVIVNGKIIIPSDIKAVSLRADGIRLYVYGGFTGCEKMAAALVDCKIAFDADL